MTDNGATRKATRKRRRPEEEVGESVSTGAKEGVGPNSGQTGGLASFLRKRKSKKLLEEAEDDRMEAKYSKGGWVWMGVYRQVRAAPVSMEVSRRHRHRLLIDTGTHRWRDTGKLHVGEESQPCVFVFLTQS